MLATRYQDMKDMLDVVKSNLVPEKLQPPSEPEALLKIGDETLKELVKNLSLNDSKDVLALVKGLIDDAASGYKKMKDAGKTNPASAPTED
jgi:hypothetical protein